MISRISSVVFDGMLTKHVDVQASISSGLPAFNIVGLGDKAVSESKERLRSAFNSLGLALPASRITINLSPADLLKEGSHFDLPIALAILGAMNVISKDDLLECIAIGEISLDGGIKNVNGCLAASFFASDNGYGFIFPQSQLNEIYFVKDKIKLMPINNLMDIINHFKGVGLINIKDFDFMQITEEEGNFVDIGNIKGHKNAKIALEVAAAGGHNVLMIGPPGSGKSMLANSMAGLLPKLSAKEALEVSLIYSIAGELNNKSLITARPFRAPHHSASGPSLVGGGNRAKAGEITLAHRGVLFLDELPEFPQNILDTLRQPIESGIINISRVNFHYTYPAQFQLIAAMNPCKCGYFGDSSRQCNKIPVCANNYFNKISGPIMDRIDMVLDIESVSMESLNEAPDKNLLKTMKERINNARQVQELRYEKFNILTNSQANSDVLDETVNLDDSAKKLLQNAVDKFKLSTRAYYRLMRVARTIADLNESQNTNENHVSQALSYRKINY